MSDFKIKISNFRNSLKRNGINTEFRRLKNYIKYRKTVLDDFKEWILLNEPSETELNVQREYKSRYNLKFLIIVPTEEAKKNIGNQTYNNYEIVSLESNSLKDIILNSKEEFCIFVGNDIILQDFALYNIQDYIRFNNISAIYSDNDNIIDGERTEPEFKPDFSYHTILSKNYIGNFLALDVRLLKNNIDIFNNISKEELIYDLILELVRQNTKFYHIAKILYHKVNENINTEEQKRVIKKFLNNSNIKYTDVTDGEFKGQYKIDYVITDSDKISIVIPNMDHKEDLEKCINSILKSSYKNYEIIIVENNSKKTETFEYYKELEENHNNIKVEKLEITGFNYSRICNYGVEKSSGKYILLLNNDIEIINEDWLEQMLMYVQNDNVGICGARLYFDDDSIQHAGVIIGIRGLAGHRYREVNKSDFSSKDNISYVQDLSAVTAACLMVKRADYDKVLGLDENLAVAFNDVDFCLKIRDENKYVVYNPFVEAHHYESKSRGEDTENKEKQERFAREYAIFVERWRNNLSRGDQYYNCNYRLDTDIPMINYNKIV